MVVANLWRDKYKEFKKLGATLTTVSYRSGINYSTLWYHVNRLQPKKLPQKTLLTDAQQALMTKIISPKMTLFSAAVAAELWHKNRARLFAAGIDKRLFCNQCRIKMNSFHAALLGFKKGAASQQKIQQNAQPRPTESHNKAEHHDTHDTALSWLKNDLHLLKHRASLALLTTDEEIKITTMADVAARHEREELLEKERCHALINDVTDKQRVQDKQYLANEWKKNVLAFKKAKVTRKIFAQHHKISHVKLDSLIRECRNKQVNSETTSSQHEFIKELVEKAQCQGNIKKSVDCYFSHQEEMRRNNITIYTFALKCQVNPNSFKFSFSQRKALEKEFTFEQHAFLQKIMSVFKFPNDLQQLALFYLKHKREMYYENITQGVFARFNKIPVLRFRNRIQKLKYFNSNAEALGEGFTRNSRLKSALKSRKGMWEALSPDKKDFINELISQRDCANSASRSASIWLENRKQIEEKGIGFLAFSFACDVRHDRLLSSVHNYRALHSNE